MTSPLTALAWAAVVMRGANMIFVLSMTTVLAVFMSSFFLSASPACVPLATSFVAALTVSPVALFRWLSAVPPFSSDLPATGVLLAPSSLMAPLFVPFVLITAFTPLVPSMGPEPWGVAATFPSPLLDGHLRNGFVVVLRGAHGAVTDGIRASGCEESHDHAQRDHDSHVGSEGPSSYRSGRSRTVFGSAEARVPQLRHDLLLPLCVTRDGRAIMVGIRSGRLLIRNGHAGGHRRTVSLQAAMPVWIVFSHEYPNCDDYDDYADPDFVRCRQSLVPCMDAPNVAKDRWLKVRR